MKFCIFCGTKLPDEAFFCSACGRAQVNKADVAPSDVWAGTPTAAYTERGGDVARDVAPQAVATPPSAPQAIPTPAPMPPSAVPQKPRKRPARSIPGIIKNAILIALVALMLVFAFLPIVRLSVPEISRELYVDISVAQLMELYGDAGKELSDTSLQKSELVKELADLTSSLVIKYGEDVGNIENIDEIDELPEGALEIMRKMVYVAVRMAAQSEASSLPVIFYLLPYVFVLYVVLLSALLVLLILALLSACGLLRSPARYVNYLLCAAPALLFFFVLISVRAFGPASHGMLGIGVILSLVVQLIAVAGTTVYGFLFKKRYRTKVFSLVSRAAIAVLAVVAMCLVLSPFADASIVDVDARRYTAQSDLRTFVPLGGGNPYQELTDLDGDTKEWVINQVFAEFANFSSKEIRQGDADTYNVSFIQLLSVVSEEEEAVSFYMTLPLWSYLVALGMALVVWQCLVYLVSGRMNRPIVYAGKGISFLFLMFVLIALILLCDIVGDVANEYIKKGEYAIEVSAGAIAFMIVSLLAVFAPVGKKLSKRITGRQKRVSAPQAPTETAAPAAEVNGGNDMPLAPTLVVEREAQCAPEVAPTASSEALLEN